VVAVTILHGSITPSTDAPPYLRTTGDVGTMLYRATRP
jgi:hypothetical protein